MVPRLQACIPWSIFLSTKMTEASKSFVSSGDSLSHSWRAASTAAIFWLIGSLPPKLDSTRDSPAGASLAGGAPSSLIEKRGGLLEALFDGPMRVTMDVDWLAVPRGLARPSFASFSGVLPEGAWDIIEKELITDVLFPPG